MSLREFAIIIYGSTGYSGTICTEYLATKAPANVKWAIAGRDEAKLKKLASKLSDNGKKLEFFVCDACEYKQVLELAKKTKVLISFVGPYRKYGDPVVQACVEAGTDYVDVTGEPQFVYDIIEKYHSSAASKGVYLMPACGVGSLITDMAVEILKEEFLKDDTSAVTALGYVKYNGRYAKMFSNGTWNTLLNSMSNKAPRAKKTGIPKTRSAKMGTHIFRPLNNWAVPFVEGADLHIVRRSNELNLTTGNEKFTYSQYTLLPLIPPLWLIGTLFMMLVVIFFSKISLVKKWLESRTNPDRGPTKEQRADTSIDIWVQAKDDTGKSKTLHMHCPGPYETTGIACAEAALALATERESIKKVFGVVTPASVMAPQLEAHLKERGSTTWEIIDKDK